VTVSFTDKDEKEMKEKGYDCGESELGKVYYPDHGIELAEEVTVKYVEYPWITCFEVEGIEIKKSAE
jgi:hypothetical protein